VEAARPAVGGHGVDGVAEGGDRSGGPRRELGVGVGGVEAVVGRAGGVGGADERPQVVGPAAQRVEGEVEEPGTVEDAGRLSWHQGVEGDEAPDEGGSLGDRRDLAARGGIDGCAGGRVVLGEEDAGPVRSEREGGTVVEDGG